MLSLLAFSLGASRARWDADGCGSFPLNILVSDSFYSHCVSISVERTAWPLRHTHMFVFQLDGGEPQHNARTVQLIVCQSGGAAIVSVSGGA